MDQDDDDGDRGPELLAEVVAYLVGLVVWVLGIFLFGWLWSGGWLAD